MEYIIVGDTENYKECLVCLAGWDKDNAEERLNQMLTNPTENDRALMKGHSNFKVVAVESKDCWWNDPFLAN